MVSVKFVWVALGADQFRLAGDLVWVGPHCKADVNIFAVRSQNERLPLYQRNESGTAGPRRGAIATKNDPTYHAVLQNWRGQTNFFY